MKLAAVPSAMATMLAALLVLAPVLVGCGRNGHDTATYADGSTYAGDWRDNEPNGQGTITYSDGDTYTGEFKDGMRHGRGTETAVDGTTYTGAFKDGERVP